MKIVIALIAAVFCLTATPLHALDHSGTITTDETWYASDNPHIVVGTVTVNAGVTLSVEDGVTVRIVHSTYINIEGALTANGTPGTGILFTQNGALFWWGLRFPAGGTGLLEHCTIEGADYGVLALGGTVRLSSTTFKNNDFGFYGDEAAPAFLDTNNVFENNAIGIQLHDVSGLSLTTAATIRNNTRVGIVLADCHSPTLDNLTFSGNVGASGAIRMISSKDFTLGGGNTIGGSGLENSWPVTISNSFPSIVCTIPATGNTHNAIQVTGGGISGTTIWRYLGVDYVLTGIQFGGFTINAGVTVRVDSGGGIIVTGRSKLTVRGKPGTGVVFTKNGASNWAGLRFEDDSWGTIAHCTIEGADYGVWAEGRFRYTQLTSTTFRNNGVGFYGDGSAPIFRDTSSVFEDNSTGIYLSNLFNGVYMYTAATIRNNTTVGIELQSCFPGPVTLDNLTLTGNTGEYGAVYAHLCFDFTMGGGNTIGGSGLENSWPLTLDSDAYLTASSTIPSAGNTHNDIQVTGGTSRSAITWRKFPGVDYVVTGKIAFLFRGVLTIEDGVTARFNQNTNIIVDRGTLTARGTPGVGILFTQNGTSGWDGFVFEGNGTGSFEHCKIEYAENGVQVKSGTVQLTNTTLRNNNYGVWASGGALTFRNNHIIDNASYGVFLSGASPDFGTTQSEWNDIYNNGGGTPGRDLRNGQSDIDALYVYWGTKLETEIQDKIWDKTDVWGQGVVNYTPWSNDTHKSIATGITDPTDEETIPTKYALSQNYPNPFNPTTTIQYDLPRHTSVVLRIYDVSGRLVRTLFDGEVIPAGRRRVVWNGTDQSGTSVASGVYFYHLAAGDFEETKRMVLIR